MMKKWYCFILFFIVTSCEASKLDITRENIDKAPVKSIKSPDGDIIDCVNIYHQPAFDHPLLKNHTILRRPSYHPVENLSVRSKISNFTIHNRVDTKPITQLWQLNGRCPRGTIPILRTMKEDFSRASTIKRYGKGHKSSPQPSSGIFDVDYSHEHVVAYTGPGKFYGGKAFINVWQPQVQKDGEFSLSQLLIHGGSQPNQLNTIEAGWMVSPILYGDRKTRLFIYWTKDSLHSTGCCNLLCPGFIQTNKNLVLGAIVQPLSVYHGSQYEIHVYIWKDREQNAWWLRMFEVDVGYWPASLFNYLAESATTIEWSGEVVNEALDGMHTTTEMGSGHFSGEKFGGASYIRGLQVVDEFNHFRSPGELKTNVERPNCYDITLGKSDKWGDFFYYGGPGRNRKCK